MALDKGSLGLLFSELEKLQYDWQPQTPDQLLAFRKNAQTLSPVSRLFGIGADVALGDLLGENIDPLVLEKLKLAGLLETRSNRIFHSRYAISVISGHFILHDHWPPTSGAENEYIHLGRESQQLAEILSAKASSFAGLSVLDLGCSSGALSFALAKHAAKVTGYDISANSIALARATAEAYGYKNLFFESQDITAVSIEELADAAVMNPPMVVPSKDAAYPHRDGGKLGVEKPLQFLDFCARHLKLGGVVHTLATNPIVRGKDLFFDELKKTEWKVEEKQRLHSQFNQSVAVQEKYQAQGIERIELWYLSLKKN